MTDDELSKLLSQTLTLGERDLERLEADFARRREADDARLWHMVFQVVKHSQGQLDDTLKLSRAAAQAVQIRLSKG